MHHARESVAECVGAFALMFVGGGAIIVTSGSDGALLTVAVAHGLILAVMVSATMHISGGQINPAVSIALAAVRKQSWTRAGVFIVAQVCGAIIAALLLRWIFGAALGAEKVGNVGATLGSLTSGDEPLPGMAVLLEMIATFFLMFVIMGTAVDQRGVGGSARIGGFAIGLTVAADILAIGPLTGASMNPSRSIGPALAAGAWDHHWVYWVGPMVGALAAALVYVVAFDKPSATEPAASEERSAPE